VVDRGVRNVEVWWREPSLDGADLLVGVEHERAAAYLRVVDRARFVTGVALSRTVLGERLGVEPRDVPLDRTCERCGRPHGKPFVPGGPELSISHSADRVVLAVADVPVGVDVEKLDRDVVPTRLARRVLLPEEQAAVATPLDFLRAWARKEAVVKATGEGTSVLPRADPPGYAVADIDVGDGYVAAAAARAAQVTPI
jgi:4'-phosphopantetheinyl transferase